jgi:hypothetical protein
MALPTSDPPNTKVEYALGDFLATARLPGPHDSTNGRNTRPARASKPTFTRPVHASNDGFRNLFPHNRRGVMVRGR